MPRVARTDRRIASLLGIALTEPVLNSQFSVCLDDGRAIRWTKNYFREGRTQYTAETQRKIQRRTR